MDGDLEESIILLGVAGDLMTRHLMPSLLHLERVGALEGVDFLGIDRVDLDDVSLRARVAESLARTDHGVPVATVDRMLSRLSYLRADLTEVSSLQDTDAAALVYVALPPRLLERTAGLLSRTDPPRRLLVEKPYGTSAASAARLDELFHQVVPESQLLRADHVLHHGPVRDLDLVAGRLAHLLPWVRSVHVRWDEALVLGDRAAEFDEVGVVRDMVHSHLLQLAATVLAAVPATAPDEQARRARRAVLADLEVPSPDDAGAPWVRARYAAGTVAGQPVAAYVDEPGVKPERGTETFASVVLRLPRPKGHVDVRLTTGKALSTGRREVVLHLEGDDVPHVVRLDLSGARLRMFEDDEEDSLKAPPLHAPASAHMLSDARSGVLRRFADAESCARQWALTEAVTDALGRLPLEEYAAGSPGPEVSGGAPQDPGLTPAPRDP